ncbi:MAG: FKBP-type peptidyl-prolyl cis-trans isomerase [Ferruginibacter sp.]|nr:FKBP-type peptidyl-prolyl cis-trans isomerase [Ferruginibacter sp.]MBU9935147.1 FKBP-type peptidyl-prolyl cis-trans isomerase [Ferruginibacter sp.]HQY11467.1 FKBP-type peptidyl-prolyl cis-trans isomerase [Ferruginibacter sp.]
MKQFFYLAFCVLALAACTGGFKKGDKGLEYKLFAKGSGNKPGYGDFIQLHVKQVYNGGTKDSILYDSHDFMPRIQVFDSVGTPLEYFKIMRNLRIGDSLVIRILTDSLLSRMNGQPLPPYMKKGKFLYTHVRLVNIFKTRDQADSANNAEKIVMKPKLFKKQMEDVEKDMAKNKEQLAKDDKIIAEYLAKNNIKAEKTKWGTYVSIQAEGTGEKINFNSVVTVNYTGKTLDSGIVFDSNIDPKFMHAQPYEVKIWEVGQVIMGWTDALLQLKNGSKATVYIPSSLAYGEAGNGDKIKPNSILVFDMEVKDVMAEEAYTAKQNQFQQEMMRKMQEEEKARVDSIEKATKK